jgi:hypothetical protein
MIVFVDQYDQVYRVAEQLTRVNKQKQKLREQEDRLNKMFVDEIVS